MGSRRMSIKSLIRVSLLLGVSATTTSSLLAQGSIATPPQPPSNRPASPLVSTDSVAPGNVIASSNPISRSNSSPTVLSTSTEPINPAGSYDNSSNEGGGRLLPPLGSGTNFVNPSGVTPVSSTTIDPNPIDSKIASSTPPISSGPSNPPFTPSGPFAPVLSGNNSSLSVRVEGTAQAIAGELLHYTIVVRNTGTMALQEVRLEQRIPAGVTVTSTLPKTNTSGDLLVWNLGKLEPNAERPIRLDIQPGSVDELSLDPVVSYKVSHSLKTKVQQPPFQVVQKGPDTLEKGSKGIVQLTVSNQGATALHSVRVRVVLSPGLKHAQGAQIEAGLDLIKPGEKRTLPLEILAISEGPQSVSVVATSQEGPVCRSKHLIGVKETPLALITSSAPVPGSADVELRLDLTNTTTAVVRNLRMVIQYPDGLEVHRVSHEGKLDLPNHLMHWSGLDELAPGKTMTILAHLHPPAPGEWPLQIVLTGDGLPENRSNHVIRVVNPGVSPSVGLAAERIR